MVVALLAAEFATTRGDELRQFLEECAEIDNLSAGSRHNGSAESDERPRKKCRERFKVIGCDAR